MDDKAGLDKVGLAQALENNEAVLVEMFDVIWRDGQQQGFYEFLREESRKSTERVMRPGVPEMRDVFIDLMHEVALCRMAEEILKRGQQ
jgi:hypothetical protein